MYTIILAMVVAQPYFGYGPYQYFYDPFSATPTPIPQYYYESAPSQVPLPPPPPVVEPKQIETPQEWLNDPKFKAINDYEKTDSGFLFTNPIGDHIKSKLKVDGDGFIRTTYSPKKEPVESAISNNVIRLMKQGSCRIYAGRKQTATELVRVLSSKVPVERQEQCFRYNASAFVYHTDQDNIYVMTAGHLPEKQRAVYVQFHDPLGHKSHLVRGYTKMSHFDGEVDFAVIAVPRYGLRNFTNPTPLKCNWFDESKQLAIMHCRHGHPQCRLIPKSSGIGKNILYSQDEDKVAEFDHRVFKFTEHGESGSPIFNDKGEVCGMHIGHLTESDKTGVALKIEAISRTR